MATAHRSGTADILYTPPGQSQVEHTLAYPLMISPREAFTSRRKQRQFTAWSADGRVREVFTIGGFVDEIVARVRFENEPDNLRTLCKTALDDNVTLTYRPTGSGGNTYDCLLVEVLGGQDPGDVVLVPDPGRFGDGEWQADLVLRTVDGTDFDTLITP